jgi:hypothetical protein
MTYSILMLRNDYLHKFCRLANDSLGESFVSTSVTFLDYIVYVGRCFQVQSYT